MDLKEVNWWAGWPFTCNVSAMPVILSLGQNSNNRNDCESTQCHVALDKPARLSIRLLFGFVSDSDTDSVFVRLKENINKY